MLSLERSIGTISATNSGLNSLTELLFAIGSRPGHRSVRDGKRDSCDPGRGLAAT